MLRTSALLLAFGLGLGPATNSGFAADAPPLPPAAPPVVDDAPLDDATVRADVSAYRRDLLFRLRDAMVEARQCEAGLTAWFSAERLEQAGKMREARRVLLAGLDAMPADLPRLADPVWPKTPTDVKLELLETVPLPDMLWAYGDVTPTEGVEIRVASFQADGLQQYGVVVQPTAPGAYPLILYMHGAAFGVPTYSLPMLAELAARGYVVVAPALRGEDLFAGAEYLRPGFDKEYVCEGKIENFAGEVTDALAMVDGARRLPNVRPGKFGIMGHSFGSGIGLLVAARSPDVACVVSYDAWFVNPFRYYWDRLSGGANNWLSWEAYLEQPVGDQLNGLMRRSLVHNVATLDAPVLLFMGGGYNGSVFHESHDDLVRELRRLHKPFEYRIIPGGGHNFLLYPRERPARTARVYQDAWLAKYLPPVAPVQPAAPVAAPTTPPAKAAAP